MAISKELAKKLQHGDILILTPREDGTPLWLLTRESEIMAEFVEDPDSIHPVKVLEMIFFEIQFLTRSRTVVKITDRLEVDGKVVRVDAQCTTDGQPSLRKATAPMAA